MLIHQALKSKKTNRGIDKTRIHTIKEQLHPSTIIMTNPSLEQFKV